MGRPTDFTGDLAAEIAARVAEGQSLKQIAEAEGMPGLRTMMRWSSVHPEFAGMLAHARLDKAAGLMDESIVIADEPVADVAQAARNRVRVQARQYMAARLDPARWAEKIGIGAAVGLPPLEPPSMLEAARRMAFVFRVGEQELQEGRAAQRPALPQLGYVQSEP